VQAIFTELFMNILLKDVILPAQKKKKKEKFKESEIFLYHEQVIEIASLPEYFSTILPDHSFT